MITTSCEGGRRRAVLLGVYRAYLGVVMVAAAVLPLLLAGRGHARCADSEVLTSLVLIGASALNVELGRLAEGGVAESQRPHKALSAWAFASALLLPTWWLLPVVAITYAHAWWRGLRVPVLKWIGSGAYLVLCGVGAAVTAASIAGHRVDLMAGSGLRGLVAVLAASAVFLGVETALFHVSAYLNRPEEEVWLRATLRSRTFYFTESSVLLIGGLSAAVWTGGPWILGLLVPVYGLVQRAVLHEPLRQRADYDEKTGLLRFEAWRRFAAIGATHCLRVHRPWSVLFIDIDHFKGYNDAWGHLAGDQALGRVARVVAQEIGPQAFAGRFGGEEFCVFVQAAREDAASIAERIRAAVEHLVDPVARALTVSVGLAAVAGGEATDLDAVIGRADEALFTAKEAGRNRVFVHADR